MITPSLSRGLSIIVLSSNPTMFSQSRQLKLSHFQKLNFVAQTVTAKGTRSIPVDSIVLEKQKLVFAALIVSCFYMKQTVLQIY